jgi:predicted glycogen debranching enzyme
VKLAHSRWNGLADGPWPSVSVGGELERCEREWLHTNGAGAYAMSTIAVMHTRRQHGLLVAALDPPLGRHVILSHAESSATVGDRTYRLSTHQFPEVAPTPGYRVLQEYHQDPLPRWVLKLGKTTLERTLCLVRGKNAVVLAYTNKGKSPIRLTVMPLLPLRPVHRLASEHGAMVQTVVLRPGAVEIQPLPTLPPITFGHRGMFMGSPDWWRRFEYAEDLGRYSDYQEDMWTPGTFELLIEPGATSSLVCAVGSLPEGDPAEHVARARAHLLAQDPGPDFEPAVRALSVAADAYCADECARPSILAGYPWLEAFTRDALVALPGLHLARGHVREAERVLESVIGLMRAGLVLDRLPWDGQRGRRSPDATLWLFSAARELLDRTGPDTPFVKNVLYPALRRAFVRLSGLRSRPRRLVWLTDEGLIATSASDRPLTWMDAQFGSWIVTPRRGLAIEHQALFSRACETLLRLAEARGDRVLISAAGVARRRAIAAFRNRFWCNETSYPFDCLSEHADTADAWADPSVRPNAVLALALDPDLFEPSQASAIVERARRELLTPRGLRSLSPRDRAYRGHYEGTTEEREASYHQGTAWTFLLRAYVKCALALAPDDVELAAELRRRVAEACEGGPVLGHVVQIADGEEPHKIRGCPAQAWSVAETLRALVVDLEKG